MENSFNTIGEGFYAHIFLHFIFIVFLIFCKEVKKKSFCGTSVALHFLQLHMNHCKEYWR